MRKKTSNTAGAVAAVVAVLATTACDGFLDVENPTVIDASTIDPVADAPTFAQSALNNLYTALDNVAVYQGWFVGEAWVGDTFPTRNDIATRRADLTNGTVTDDVYEPLALAIATGERTQELLAEVPNAASNINIARASLASGYGILLMSETFCQTVISSGLANLGAPLERSAALQAAAVRFRQAVSVGGANTTSEGASIANAARVGLARTLLSAGDNAGAIAAAQQVPAGFQFLAPRVDDPSNRGPLGNTVYSFTLARPALVVPPYYRALNDPRIKFAAPGTNGFPAKAQGNDLDFFRQTKYVDWGDDVRLASGLEARYIVAEAQLKMGNSAPALALIAERTVASSADGDNFASGSEVLIELLDQRARDFWLEAQQMGTWLRNPQATPYVLPAGSAYYAPGYPTVGTGTCLPLPDDEIDNNPNFRS